MQKIASVRVLSSICWQDAVEHLDRKFYQELLMSGHNNITLEDHLEHFLDPNWTESSSFCNYAQSEDGRTETYATEAGLCFILNPGEGIFNEKRLD